MAAKQIKKRSIRSVALLLLSLGTIVTSAIACENPWGSAAENQKSQAGLPKFEDVRLCLPAGFAGEVTEDSVSFRDPKDAQGSRGSLGLAISAGSNYRASDSEADYRRLEGWLCQLANVSAGTRCSITRLKDNLFVLLKSLGIGVYSEVYIHTGDGYMLALTADAPNEAALSSLRPVIENANIP